MEEVRIDRWMWATRIFKTRTIATDACKKSRVTVNGLQAKPSRMVRVGDVVQVRKPPVTYSFRILALAQNRMGAKLVKDFLENNGKNHITKSRYFYAVKYLLLVIVEL